MVKGVMPKAVKRSVRSQLPTASAVPEKFEVRDTLTPSTTRLKEREATLLGLRMIKAPAVVPLVG